MTDEKFEFENLKVWEKSIDFVDDIFDLIDKIESGRRHYRLMEQIESSSVSVPANIAEGKGRHTDKDYLRFLYYSRGSLFETITILRVFKRRKWISSSEYATLRSNAIEIGKMLNGLIRSVKRRA